MVRAKSEVTVVMPVFGDAPFLRVAVESVLKQDLTDWTLKLVLDRPSHSTIKECRNFSLRDSRIHYLRSERPGIGAALNLGIAESATKFVARLDSDDFMAPHRLSEQLREMKGQETLVVLGSQSIYVNQGGTKMGVSSLPRSEAAIRYCLTKFNVISHPTVMMLKSALIEVGGYDEKFDGVEDYFLWLKLSQEGVLRNSSSFLTYYRRHPNQATWKSKETLKLLCCVARLEHFDLDTGLNPEKWIEYASNNDGHLLSRLVVRSERSASQALRRELGFARLLGSVKTSTAGSRILLVCKLVVLMPEKLLKSAGIMSKARWQSTLCGGVKVWRRFKVAHESAEGWVSIGKIH